MTSSETTDAFHAPPVAVSIPVTRYGKIAGKINVFHFRHPVTPYVTAASFRSDGMAIAPAITEHATLESARQAVLDLLALAPARRPTAIFTANNRCTIGALHAGDLLRNGIALVGFDEFELADLLGVTVVRTDPYRMGQVAAELALRRIGADPRPVQQIVLPVELVVRGSGELAP